MLAFSRCKFHMYTMAVRFDEDLIRFKCMFDEDLIRLKHALIGDACVICMYNHTSKARLMANLSQYWHHGNHYLNSPLYNGSRNFIRRSLGVCVWAKPPSAHPLACAAPMDVDLQCPAMPRLVLAVCGYVLVMARASLLGQVTVHLGWGMVVLAAQLAVWLARC